MNPWTWSRKDVSELGWIEREKVYKELLEEGIRWAEIYREIAITLGKKQWLLTLHNAYEYPGAIDFKASELFQRRTK